MILEMMLTSCEQKAHYCISVVSGRGMDLAYPCLHRLQGECEAVVAADVADVDDSAGKAVVLEDYPFSWLAFATERNSLTGLET